MADDALIWLLVVAVGILAGGLIAALMEVHALHSRAMRAWTRVDVLQGLLRAERARTIATRDDALRRIRHMSQRTAELEELAHCLALLTPIEMRDTMTKDPGR